MRIALNASAELLHADLGRLRDHAAQAADDGFSGWWLAQTGLIDALTAFTALADTAPGLEFGTAVIPTFPRHPTALAGQALTTQAALGDRPMVLGIGLSHRPMIEGMLGLSFEKPVRHLIDYLEVLQPLLETGTVAVVAGGIDVVYPKENAGLYDKIKEQGAIISEVAACTQPQARHFPRRNRLISGIARGVVVVEASPRSGSLITARMALEQNREVFAVPGAAVDPRAKGTNHLIRQGAILTESADDVLQALNDAERAPLKDMEDIDFKRIFLMELFPNKTATIHINNYHSFSFFYN
mgnify:CR=1 FL=1